MKNVTDPVQEFWEKKALEQSSGVGKNIFKEKISKYIIKHIVKNIKNISNVSSGLKWKRF